jgi:hypothetical protein
MGRRCGRFCLFRPCFLPESPADQPGNRLTQRPMGVPGDRNHLSVQDGGAFASDPADQQRNTAVCLVPQRRHRGIRRGNRQDLMRALQGGTLRSFTWCRTE